MHPKSIVIAPCGNKSYLFKDQWLKFRDEKEFDLCLMFYHAEINNPSLYADADFFFHLKDFKYHMLYNLLTNIKPEWINTYDYFYFLDDDIEIDTRGINEMFRLSHSFQSSISQASLSQDSFCSWPMFKQQKGSFLRYVGQIEVMAPLFDRSTLVKCLPSFIDNRSSWGVDSVWSRILDYPKDKLIVFDKVIMKHTLPVGGGELYQRIGVNPHVEWKAITDKYDARKHNYREYGRLDLVNAQNNRLNYFFNKTKERFQTWKRVIRDYDFWSRVQSKKNKLFRF